jgi:large repetitive protein
LITNNSLTQNIPAHCSGGTTTVSWIITDLCDTITLSAQFIVTPAPAVTYNQPSDLTTAACSYTAQAGIDAAFATWVATQTAAIAQGGGCNPQITNNSLTQIIPAHCSGGTTTVTWTITDLCDTITLSAQFIVTPAPAVTYNQPSDLTTAACSYTAQSGIDAAFATWVATQTAAIAQAGGCNPMINDNSLTQSIPAHCSGGTTTVSWTITDLCDTITLSAQFIVTPAPAVTYNQPSDLTTAACSYSAQAGIDAAFATWVATQTAAIAQWGGCSPQIINNSSSQSIPAHCSGGAVTVTWTITDLCDTITLSAQFIVTPAPAVTYNQPSDLTTAACSYTAQAGIDAAFATWVATQTAAIAQAGGCNPLITNNSLTQSIPVHCSGGAVTVTWTITDLCDTITLSAQFIVTPAPAVTYNQPFDLTTAACSYTAQAGIDAAFVTWVAAQTAAIAQAGGCNPLITNNSLTQNIPAHCSGGTTTVSWIITDLCDTITLSAQFIVTPAPAVTYNQPSDLTTAACSYTAQAGIDAAFATWVATQTAAIAQGGGCNPVITNNSLTQNIPAHCSGGTVTVTWTITDLCDTITLSAQFIVTPAPAVTYNQPSDLTTAACNYTVQAGIDAAFAGWVATQTAAIAQGGGCNPMITDNSLTQSIPAHCSGGTATVTWTITDLCDTITLSAQFIVTPAPAVTYNQPSDLTTAACSYTAQAGIDAAFATGGLLLRPQPLLRQGDANRIDYQQQPDFSYHPGTL